MRTPTVLSLMIMQIGLVHAQNDQSYEDDEQIVITATRQNKKKLDTPETVDVVTRKQIEQENITDIQTLTRHLPGVSVSRTTSGTDPFGNLEGFRIRGASGNRVQMQVDGSRVIEQASDGNRNFVDLGNMKAVEIVRGPGSVLWGADALGGIVSFRTIDPDDLLKGKEFGGKASMGFNSLNQEYSQNAALAAQFSENTQGLLSVTHRTYKEAKLRNAKADGGIWGCPRVADAIRCNKLNPLETEVFSVLSKFVWTPTDNHEVKFTGEYYSSDTDIKQMYDYGRQVNKSFNGDYLRNQKQTRANLAVEDTWRPEVGFLDQVKWQLSYSPQKRRLTNNRDQITATGKSVHTYSHTHYEENFLQADIQLTSSLHTGSVQHLFTYGFQGDRTKTNYDNLSVTNTNGVIVNKPAGGFNFANAVTNRADLYIQDEIKFFDGKFTVTPGVRWATYNIKPKADENYKKIPGKEPREIDSKEWIPQVGVLYKITDNYSVYGRYAEGFKMPTAQQLFTSTSTPTSDIIPNPDLKAEKVKSYEAGVRGEYKNAWFSFGAFQADYSNYIQSLVNISPGNYTYANLSEVEIWGLETSAEWQFLPNWRVNASASYQYGKQREKPGAHKTYFDYASPLNGTLGLKWTKPEWRFDAEVMGIFAKGISRTSKDTIYKPAGYAVFDSYFSWKLTNNISVNASVQNMFNKRYFDAPLARIYNVAPSASERATNPLELQVAPGRTYGLSISSTF